MCAAATVTTNFETMGLLVFYKIAPFELAFMLLVALLLVALSWQ